MHFLDLIIRIRWKYYCSSGHRVGQTVEKSIWSSDPSYRTVGSRCQVLHTNFLMSRLRAEVGSTTRLFSSSGDFTMEGRPPEELRELSHNHLFVSVLFFCQDTPQIYIFWLFKFLWLVFYTMYQINQCQKKNRRLLYSCTMSNAVSRDTCKMYLSPFPWCKRRSDHEETGAPLRPWQPECDFQTRWQNCTPQLQVNLEQVRH